MNPKIKNILVVASATALVVYLVGISYYNNARLGATITTIQSTDTLKDSRAVINTNFDNLNNDRVSTTTAQIFSALQQFSNSSSSLFSCYGPCYFGATATSSFSTAGALTLVTALATTSGGTGTTTPTFGITANLFATSTTNGISTTTEDFLSVRIPTSGTIIRFDCYADPAGAVTIRATGASNPISAGTDLLYTTGVNCGATATRSTTTFSATAISAGDWMRFYVSEATGTRPTIVYTSFTIRKNE